MANSKIDENRTKSLLGVSSVDSLTPVAIEANPTTKSLNVEVSNTSVAVSGTVTANLSATDNAVLDDIALDTEAIKTAVEILDNVVSGTKVLTTEDNSSAIKTAVEVIDNAISGSEMQVDIVTVPTNGLAFPTITSYTTDDVNLAANTADQAVVAAQGASTQIWVYGLVGTVDVAGTISIQDEDNTALSGVMPVGATGGLVLPISPDLRRPWFKVATNKALEIDTVTCTFDGIVCYAIVSV